jgi:hypothetical protein
VTGAVDQAVAELLTVVACRASAVTGVEAEGGGVEAEEGGGTLGDVLAVAVGEEPPAQPPATVRAVRMTSAVVPLMAVASVDGAG